MTVAQPAPRMPHLGIVQKFRPMLTAAAVPLTTGVSCVRCGQLTPLLRMSPAPCRTEPDISAGTPGPPPKQAGFIARWMYGVARAVIVTTPHPITIDQYVSTARYVRLASP